MSRKMSGVIRLVAVVVLALTVLPIVFQFYCNIRPGAAPEEIGNALIASVPLGEQILNTALAVTGNGAEGLTSALDWMNVTDVSEVELLMLEVSQLFLISVIMLALESLIDLALRKVDYGIFNQIANVLLKALVVFTAALLAKWVYLFFLEQVSQMTGVSQHAMIYTVSLLSVIGSVVALVFGKGILRSLLKCSLKMFEAMLTFALAAMLLLGTFPWFVIILVWILLIWGCYFVEKLIG